MSKSKSRPKRAKSRPLSELVEAALASFKDVSTELEEEWAVEQEWGEPEKTRSAWDEKEASQATVRSACVAAHQRFSRSGNALHVWEAILMCTSPSVAPMMLPDWCISYLNETAQGLLAVEGDGEKLAAFIAKQLKFTKRGWTAVKARASEQRAISAALLYDELCFCEGMSPDEAYERVRQDKGFSDVSSARKLVQQGHIMLHHTPTDP